MYIHQPSVTKIKTADRVNLLDSARCRFKQYESLKPGKLLISLPGYTPFHDSPPKDSCF